MPENTQVATQQNNKPTLTGLLSSDSVKKRFEEMMGKKSASFISSIISATKANPELALCDPNTIISSAVIAATLDLPIQSNLGFAAMVPYNSKEGKKAQFQIMARGYVQLGIRTAMYKTIHVTEVYEGELTSYNRITGDVVIDPTKKVSDEEIGYCAYFKLISGFEKYLYWTKKECEAHGKKYSKSYDSKFGKWQTDFSAMAKKTVLKQLMSKYGILSVEMQRAIEFDQSVVKENEDGFQPDYVDNQEAIDLKPLSDDHFNQIMKAIEDGKHDEIMFILDMDFDPEQKEQIQNAINQKLNPDGQLFDPEK